MNWLYVVSALVALALLIYLLVALLKPEELG
ncbi:MAG: K(+)-transporting ATPase subunit F [Acidobacteriia bacterium]|nr:K(+)-transporting ATPase subunit F [Terriglobia bacterium]